MLIKGEKYACEACVRGHRVSNCQHSDRPLQHINKKGRPVSQCSHCRTLRKSRSAHVRCDCGEKAHNKASACGSHEGESPSDVCCCSSGGRCTCALKKEHLDPVPESDSDEASASPTPATIKRRPRAHTVQSETVLTVFTNGHHKPVHKHNNMAHKCGLPYVVPRSHSVNGLSSASLRNRSVDSLPQTNTLDALPGDSHIKASIASAQQEQRKAKSEHGSPLITSNLDQLNGMLPPLDFSSLPGDYNLITNLDTFSGFSDPDQPLFSAGLSTASIDWSLYDGLDFNNDSIAASSYSQAASFNGFDFSNIEQPALTTTSTSGEISEVEDYAPRSEPGLGQSTLQLQQRYGSDFDASDLGDGYRLSAESSYANLPQSHVDDNIGVLDMDAFLKDVMPPGYPTIQNEISNTSTYMNDNKLNHALPTFDDGSNFPTILGEDDTDTFWMNAFASAQIPINSGRGDLSDGDIWAQ